MSALPPPCRLALYRFVQVAIRMLQSDQTPVACEAEAGLLAAHRTVAGAAVCILQWVRQHFNLYWRRHTTRQTLAELDAHLRKDIGVTAVDAGVEARKPFWYP